MIFDAPDIEGPPSKRLAAAEQSIAGCPWARIIEHRVCKGEHELKADLDRVLDLGGEARAYAETPPSTPIIPGGTQIT